MTLYLKNLAIHNRQGEALLHNLDLTIQNGEVVCVMGPSGCGKSTLLNLIAGHLSDDFQAQGEIILDEREINQVEAHQREVGILFQDDLLFPHLNVWQNLAFALPNQIKGQQRKKDALQALQSVGLDTLANQYPEHISGGQRARVSLIRMLLAKPKLALLDEPFSKLDQQLRVQFRDWVFSQLSKAHIPTLLVTHDEQDVPPEGRILHWRWGK
ncbi:ATP-binding cassette domain-containing protein [Vibrio cholerae]